MVAICREMGWDYYTYVAQPLFFLEAVKIHMLEEQKSRLAEFKKQQRARK